jgi:phenylpropionate dioxygenase-like ring-hydroxylating dioxygenase large terminal subunit
MHYRPLFLMGLGFFIKVSSCFFISNNLLPFWYPLIPSKELMKNKIHKINFMDTPFVCYKKNNETFIVHTDICPHQGASLGEKGYINKDGNLQCGYHGFEFCDGNFCKIPNPSKNPKRFKSKINLPMIPIKKMPDFLFFNPLSEIETPEIFYPPEEFDDSFKGVDGYRIVNSNYLTVCENLLDMLHISYVHSFGSSVSPLPYDIKTKRLSNNSFQSQFHYYPNENTISTKVGGAPKVIVQNEYHLPTNTITRVFAGDIVKTVFTRSIPISKNQTLLYWKMYRNFWLDPFFPVFNVFGDWLTKFLMSKTIDEDVEMLKSVYDDHRVGSLVTKYDITIVNFRKDMAKFLDKN